MWINLDEQQLRLLQQRVPELHARIQWRDADQEKFFRAACEHSNDDIEFDPDAVVSQGDDGAFVMAWYWVSNDDAGIEEEDDE
jgi:hypothetical protein